MFTVCILYVLNSVSTLLEIISEALFAVQRTLGRCIDMPEQQMGDERGAAGRGCTSHLIELVGFDRFFKVQCVMYGNMLVKI